VKICSILFGGCPARCLLFQVNPQLLPLRQNVVLSEKPLVTKAFLAFRIVEDLRGNQLDLVRLGGVRILPDIDELHLETPGVFAF
jgi:hypothetical protein